MQTLESIQEQIGAPEPDGEALVTEELREWKDMIDNSDMRGLRREENGQWVFDLRYRYDSQARALYGPRACDLAINGPDVIEMPQRICAALGLATGETNTSQVVED